MKKFTLLFLFLLCTSCKSFLTNYYLKSIGIYDKSIQLEKIANANQEIIFFGMHHIGKEEFYTDVNTKIDSLQKKGYFFYVEGVKSQIRDIKNPTKEDSVKQIEVAYKFRKINGKPLISKKLNTDYLTYFKENGIKIKEKIIKQPSYLEFGLTEVNSKNTDLSIVQILENYEKKYGKIVLESCDYETKFYEESICLKKTDQRIYDEMLMQDRNNSVITSILNEKRSKLAIIYGKAHFVGIKDSLEKLGYKTTK